MKYKRLIALSVALAAVGLLAGCSSDSDTQKTGAVRTDGTMEGAASEIASLIEDPTDVTESEAVLPSEDIGPDVYGAPDIVPPEGVGTWLPNGYYLATATSSDYGELIPYTINDDYTAGTFFISSFLKLTQQEVDTLNAGDTILYYGIGGGNAEAQELTVESFEFPYIVTSPMVSFNEEGLMLVEQHTGEYYLTGGIDQWATVPLGRYTLDISPELRIFDRVSVFTGENPFGETEYGIEMSGLEEFDDLLENGAWTMPDLLIHVNDGRIDLMCINPACHQDWRMDPAG